MKTRILWIFIACFYFILSSVPAVHPFFNSDVRKAKKFMQVDMYSDAIQLLKKRIKEKPDDAEAHYLLGICYVYTERNRFSLISPDLSFKRAMKLNPDYRQRIAEHYKSMAYSSLGSNDLRMAKIYYDKMVKYNYDLFNPEFLNQIGYRYLKLAVDSDGSAMESHLKSATKYVGSIVVKQVCPSVGTKTIFDGYLTEEDADEKGFIWLKKFILKTEDVVEIKANIPEGAGEIELPWLPDTDPPWYTTQNGRFLKEIRFDRINRVIRSGSLNLCIRIDKGKGIKAKVTVTRKVILEPNITLLYSLIKKPN